MTSETGIGRIIVVAVVTGSTIIGYGSVGAVQGIIIIVIGKGCRHPVGVGGMTGRAIHGKA